METFRVAAISMASPIANPVDALARHAQWAHRAKSEGAQLVLFPELSVSGYFFRHSLIRYIAEPMSGQSVRTLTKIASDVGVILCAGMFEREADAIYNTQVLVGPSGIIGKQRKISEPTPENRFWSGGDAVRVFHLGFAHVGIAICYDSLVSQHWQLLYRMGAEVVLLAFADATAPRPTLPETHPELITYRAHAYRYGCYGVMANAAGGHDEPDEAIESIRFGGWCGVIDPRGNVQAFTRDEGNDERMVVTDLDPDKLNSARSCQYFIPRCTRAEIYRRLENSQGSQL